MIVDVPQQSVEWLQMRCGCATGSRIVDIVTRLKRNSASGQKGDYAKSRQGYLMELVAERLTGRSADHYVTQWMEEGMESEPLAKAAYELATDATLQNGGFALHPRIKWFGASADSLVNDDGILECKCLKSVNHLDILQSQEIPAEFMPQMMAELACTERQWVDFVSFDPRMPHHLRTFIKRFHRNEELIALMESEVETFLAEVEARMASLAELA